MPMFYTVLTCYMEIAFAAKSLTMNLEEQARRFSETPQPGTFFQALSFLLVMALGLLAHGGP